MKPRPDLLSHDSPDWLEIYQITTEEAVTGSHIYMEAQIFTPDSKRLIVHRSATAHGGDKDDPEHRYLVCDLENGGELSPITTETGATAPSVTPDGQFLYYFVDETVVGGGRLTLKRVHLDGTGRETIHVIDSQLVGTHFRPSFIYPLSTISSDGQRLALSCFLRDGDREDLPWGLMVYDLSEPSVRVIIHGNTWTNMHPQYCRSRDPEASHEIMIQHNHSHFFDRTGTRHFSTNGRGNDIHIIRDDGTNLRTFPWGRNGRERTGGHECWIGRTQRAIGVTSWPDQDDRGLMEGQPLPDVGHRGVETPGAAQVRNHLTRDLMRPNLVHFGVDIAGTRILADEGPRPEKPQGYIHLAKLPQQVGGPLTDFTPLLDIRCSWIKQSHPHPFLSPDGMTGFFNSDESGILQAYMVKGWS